MGALGALECLNMWNNNDVQYNTFVFMCARVWIILAAASDTVNAHHHHHHRLLWCALIGRAGSTCSPVSFLIRGSDGGESAPPTHVGTT